MKQFDALAKIAAFVTAIVYAGTGTAHDWNVGDVFAAIGNGRYAVFDNNGNFKEEIDGFTFSFETTGCAFNNDRSQLYTTHFTSNEVIAFDVAHPHNSRTIATADESSPLHPESIAFYSDGSFTVGYADGNHALQQFNSADKLARSFFPAVENRGIDWHDPSTDQRTVFYTSEGRKVLRFDIGSDSQLADFARLPDDLPFVGTAFALRLLPPGDGSGGLIVADFGDIKRLDGFGVHIQTYDVGTGELGDPALNSWFSLALDANGTSFWAGDISTDGFYRFNIESGAIEVDGIDSGGRLRGLCVLEEPLTTSVKVCAPEDQPTPEQCDAAKGGEVDVNYLVGYGVDFGAVVICPCEGTDLVQINIRDCTMDQNLRDQANNCFADGTQGFDDGTQSQSIVGGSTCAIHCFSLDGRRICKEVCTD